MNPSRSATPSANGTAPTDTASAVARECAAIAADLERLKALIADAGDKLLSSFNAVSTRVPHMAMADAERAQVVSAITTAVTALQFQDMATQLTGHAQGRLAVLQDCLRRRTPDPAEIDPLLVDTRMQPVRQSAVGAGSIDLF